MSAKVICFTTDYSFKGAIITGRRRLSDLLNDRSMGYVELNDVEVCAVQFPDSSIRDTTAVSLHKKSLMLVAILSEEGQPAEQQLYGSVGKQRHDVVLYVQGYEVRGAMHLPGKQVTHRELVADAERFLPLVDAEAVASSNPLSWLRVTTMLVRGGAIDGVMVESGPATRYALPGRAAL